MNRSYDQLCPIARTLDLIGDRWTLLIVRDLFFRRSKFKDLLAHSPGMPTKILSQRLQSLEAAGLVERTIYTTHPLRAEYHLSDAGRSLAPVMEAIVNWGMEHTLEGQDRAKVRKKIRADVASVPGGARAMGWRSPWVREGKRSARATSA
jgi:DNA-binding HxlR family transcriptional regulator